MADLALLSARQAEQRQGWQSNLFDRDFTHLIWQPPQAA
jgi:hypothetical protein